VSINTFGIYIHDEYDESVIERTINMGSEFCYVLIKWADVEPNEGEWVWEEADKKIFEKTKKGLQVGVKLISSNRWNDLGAQRYETFVRKVVNRYNHAVKYWAIENEITARQNFIGGMRDYRPLSEIAYKTIKSIQKNSVVLNHGPSSASYIEAIIHELLEDGDEDAALAFYNSAVFPHREITPAYSLQQLCPDKDVAQFLLDLSRKYRIIIKGFMHHESYDMYQLHYYENAKHLDLVLNWIKEKKATYYNYKPIAIWELGYYWKQNVTYNQEEHAKDVFKKIIILLSHNIRMIHYHSIYGRSLKGDPWRGLYNNYSGEIKRPAAYVYEHLVELLKNSAFIKKRRINDVVDAYCFRTKRKQLFFLWSDIEQEIFLPDCLHGLPSYNIYGERIHGNQDASYSISECMCSKSCETIVLKDPIYFIK
jgi:hypothetical protein